MIIRSQLFVISFVLVSLPLPCGAQSYNARAASQPAFNRVLASPARQQQQNNSRFGMRNGLPAVNTDSFVHEAGGNAELIYGDETDGLHGPPPFNEFTQQHRIEAGITGDRAQGLTDGKASLLPNSWGGDEFVKTEPFSMHGQQVSDQLSEQQISDQQTITQTRLNQAAANSSQTNP